MTRKLYEVQALNDHAEEWEHVLETDYFDEALVEADALMFDNDALPRIITWFLGHDGWEFEVIQEF